jgi:hypothetical protein
MSDNAYLALKLVGSLIAGAYGIYATITDFHDEKNGRKVPSRAGYLGLALLGVSILLSISGGSSKEIKDRRAARAAEEDRTKLLNYEEEVSRPLPMPAVGWPHSSKTRKSCRTTCVTQIQIWRRT